MFLYNYSGNLTEQDALDNLNSVKSGVIIIASVALITGFFPNKASAVDIITQTTTNSTIV